MLLSTPELEAAAIAISVAAGCVPCTRHHISEARKLGLGTADIEILVEIALDVEEAASHELRQRISVPGVADREAPARRVARSAPVHWLAAAGAAHAANAVNEFRSSLREAREAGYDDARLMELVGLSERIKARAASHLAKPVATLEADRSHAASSAGLCT